MNITRRLLMVSVLIQGVSGCVVTKSLFKDTVYHEKLSTILISEDLRQIVFMGAAYHYIFEAPAGIVESMSSGFHQNITATFDDFHVDSKGVVTGAVLLRLSAQASDAEKISAARLGYTRTTSGTALYCCEYAQRISGIRYEANNVLPTLPSQKLNRTYDITITAEQSTAEKAAKTLLTPITATVDGLLVIGAIPLLLIASVGISGVIAAKCGGNRDCLK